MCVSRVGIFLPGTDRLGAAVLCSCRPPGVSLRKLHNIGFGVVYKSLAGVPAPLGFARRKVPALLLLMDPIKSTLQGCGVLLALKVNRALYIKGIFSGNYAA